MSKYSRVYRSTLLWPLLWLLAAASLHAAPQASNSSYVTAINTPLDITLGAAQDSALLEFGILAPPSHGALTPSFNSPGQPSDTHKWRYTPQTEFVGVDVFEFYVLDRQGERAQARVTISIEDGLINRYSFSPANGYNGVSHMYGPYVADAVYGAGKPVNFPYLQPGDRIEIEPGARGKTLRIWGLQGTAERPIVIINKGLVDLGKGGHTIELDACKYVQIMGAGDDDLEKGIRIHDGATKGIRMGEAYTQHIELAYLEIDHTVMAISFGSKYPLGSAPPTDGIHIHHNDIHDISEEAFYLGKAADQGNGSYSTTHDLRVAYNRLRDIGYEGIQIRGLRGANNRIHHNEVINTGWLHDGGPNDMHGIYGYDVQQVSIYNNLVKGSDRAGVYLKEYVQSIDSHFEVFNNLIIDSGRANNGKGHGILISSGSRASLYNNTIVGAREYGISYYSDLRSAHIANNLLADIQDLISPIRDIGNADIVVEGNEFYADPAQAQFVNADQDDYRVAASNSDIVDNATPPLIASSDYADHPRPGGPASDIGAHENQLPVSWDQAFVYPSSGTLNGTLAGYDPETDAIAYTVATPPQYGNVTLQGPDFIYVADPGFPGQDQFTIALSDGVGRSTVATVTVVGE
ncbi:Ig-like domain-containing protein [Hahella sp. KA22]|uniref:Ig-like domain-containing protein n=1 Tax=Hahella sp. KA22 TaxID=1628392 RepID=UPI0013E3C5E5|nr:Ig-like domain-containing protein [Hahella sp. KA22]